MRHNVAKFEPDPETLLISDVIMSVDQLYSMFTHDGGVLKAVLNMLKNSKKGGKDGLC